MKRILLVGLLVPCVGYGVLASREDLPDPLEPELLGAVLGARIGAGILVGCPTHGS